MSHQTSRRRFLRDGFLVTGGAVAGAMTLAAHRSLFPALLPEAMADDKPSTGRAEKRLRELGIKLPPAPKPVAVYVPAVRVGNLLFVAGHGPGTVDGKAIRGKVNQALTLEEGYAAARQVGLNVLSTVQNSLGSLDKVVRLVKTLGMVNCTTDFAKQPQVVNGFSELMVKVFGDQLGKGARSAVGVGSLPGNIPVEIECVFEVRG